jgi:beta-glucosidase
MPILSFPQDFLWGSATSSYQIEGATDEGGRGASIWDTFADRPGTIADGSNGDIACDHYHRYPQDIELMASLGLNAYRFSIAWPRILPEGRGAVNEVGLDFYDRLVDELLAKNIQPFATLYHWDMPQTLEDKGGWTVRATVDAFAEYTDAISRRLGDRVKHWMTMNEPWVASYLGYGVGVHAPGMRDELAFIRASHHLLLAHGRGLEVLRKNVSEAQVGLVNALTWVDAVSQREEDIAAARRYDGFWNRWFLDPIYRGAYPADMLDLYGAENIPVEDGDLQLISAPTDFHGINYYTRAIIGHDEEGFFLGGNRLKVMPHPNPDAEYTEMGWEVYPQGLYNMLKRLHEEYHVPAIYVTENGCALPDEVSPDGLVHDPRRVNYYHTHFAAAHQAIQEGVPLKGYFAWSLLDNFEWGEGYRKRFGIVYVDYATQQRILKDSARWYAGVIQQNGITVD